MTTAPDPLDAAISRLAARLDAWLAAEFDAVEAEAGVIGRAALRAVRPRALSWGEGLAREALDHARDEAGKHTLADAARGVARLLDSRTTET